MNWKSVRKKGITEVRPYREGEPLTDVSMQPGVSPQPGDYIARDPNNHNDQWLISKDFYDRNYEEV